MTGPRPPNRPQAIPRKGVVEAATEGLTPRAQGPQAACPESSTKPACSPHPSHPWSSLSPPLLCRQETQARGGDLAPDCLLKRGRHFPKSREALRAAPCKGLPPDTVSALTDQVWSGTWFETVDKCSR